MDTFTINCVIKQFQKNSMFKGVFPCDSIPKKFTLPAIFVINLSPHTESGSHWVSVYISSSRFGYYFDSFGLPIRNRYILHFLKKHARRIDHNKKQLQHITSIKCGQFCCAFAVTILKNGSMSTFLNRFCKNLYVNDLVIENMYKYLKNN